MPAVELSRLLAPDYISVCFKVLLLWQQPFFGEAVSAFSLERREGEPGCGIVLLVELTVDVVAITSLGVGVLFGWLEGQLLEV
jgi:hypothetical protein